MRDTDEVGVAEFGDLHDIFGHGEFGEEVAVVDIVVGEGDDGDHFGGDIDGLVGAGGFGDALQAAVGDFGALEAGDLAGGNAEIGVVFDIVFVFKIGDLGEFLDEFFGAFDHGAVAFFGEDFFTGVEMAHTLDGLVDPVGAAMVFFEGVEGFDIGIG